MKLPDLRPIPHKDAYRLIKAYEYDCWVVPVGFEYDGASILRIGWGITYTPFHPKVMVAALLHDYFYGHEIMSRKEADDIFKDILLKCGADPERVELMYHAVRMFGGSHFG